MRRRMPKLNKPVKRQLKSRPRTSIWADHSDVLLRLEQYPEAIASADRSLTYNSNNSLAFTYQCMVFYALQDYESGLDKCNEALRVNGDWGNESPALAWRYRGQILDQQGQEIVPILPKLVQTTNRQQLEAQIQF